MGRFAIVFDEKIREYDLGHVLTEERYQNFMGLFREKLGDHPEFETVSPTYATVGDLQLVHPEPYIRRIESCESMDPHDTPLSPAFVRAAKLLAGAGKLGGELVQSGKHEKAFVIGGGVQHASRSRERGFGVFSDVGVCAENLKRNFGVERLLILDTDAHAGDGIYEIFSQEPGVLFLSVHQHPLTLYPGRGFVDEIGTGDGTGFSVNIPLPPGAGDQAYALVLQEIFIPLAEEFRPEIILMVDGSDPHFSDRITHMGLTLEGIRRVGSIVVDAAEKLCGGKVVDFVGSGYSQNPKVVSMGWLASIAGVTRVAVDLEELDPVPEGIQEESGLKEAAAVVSAVRRILSPYWKCFGGT